MGQVELRAGLEPAGEVVPLRVVGDRLRRDRAQLPEQALEILRPADGGPVRKPEDEVAEREVLDDEAAQVLEKRGRAFQQELRAHLTGHRFAVRPAGLEEHRDVAVRGLDLAGELGAGERVEASLLGELDVGDDPQHVLVVGGEVVPGLLEAGAEEDLRPGPHAQDLVGHVHTLGDERLRVVDDLRVDRGQERGVVADVVLDQQDHLDAGHTGVVGDVLPVFHVLGDGQQDARVALPQEDALQGARVVVGHVLSQLAAVVCQEDDRDVQPRLFDLERQFGRLHVAHVDGGHDQVEPALAGGERDRLRPRAHVAQARGVMEVEVKELFEQELVELPVLLQDERIVGARDQDDVLHPPGHEVLEVVRVPPLQFFRLRSLRHGLAYTTPWSIMALATLRNPAMLAPFT